MKKILFALLTFTIGILAFYSLIVEQIQTPQTFLPTQKIVEVSTTKVETIENITPFFDSLSEDQVNENGQQYQGYNGWFIADDFKGMKEVWTILLSRDNENSKNEEMVWTAVILTQDADYNANENDDFHSVWIKTENNKLSFRTNKFHGVEYKFEGEFFKKGKNFAEDEKVLKGTLRKFVKGKEFAKLTTDFAYHEPVCWH